MWDCAGLTALCHARGAGSGGRIVGRFNREGCGKVRRSFRHPKGKLHFQLPSRTSNVELTGQRVRLVPLVWAHLPELCDVALDPELWRYTVRSVETREELVDYLTQAIKDGEAGTAIPYAITLIETGEIVGTTRFNHIEPQHNRLEIGFTLIGLKWHGSGINREIKHLMLDHAFNTMGCQRVEFRASADNLRSRRALEKIGAKFEAIFRNFMYSPAKGMRDVAIYSILAEEWPI